MKFRNKVPLLALAVVAAGIVSSQAAVVVQPEDGDIFLAFRASAGDGSSVSYVVNLGQYSQFSGQSAGTTVSLTGIGAIGSDLVTIFGAGWNTSGNVKWGVFGRDDTGTVSLYASREQSVLGTTGTAWASRSLSQRQSTSVRVGTVIFGINGYNGSQSTLNSPVGVILNNTVGGNPNQSSYNYQVTNGALDFGTTSGWTNIEGDFADGVSGTALDLFQINAGGVNSPGFFTIAGDGTLSFTAVPEPSAALLGVAGACLLLTRRRRSLASA
ncbi:MAG: hypothetical protein EOP85_13080 [Verrucomicrobiaceae bacterium]|nr:MAG: hypothetical protein EOP85_13080 [Verrucomicrobiaceae bacterium]